MGNFMADETLNSVRNAEDQPNDKLDIATRLNSELTRLGISKKGMSRKMKASENTLGNYTRGQVPDQWLYLQALHSEGVDIRYVLLKQNEEVGQEPTSEESVLLKAYRQLSERSQLAIMNLVVTYAQEVKNEQKFVQEQ